MIESDFGPEADQRTAAAQAPAAAPPPWKIILYAMLRSRRLVAFALVLGGLVGFVMAALQLNVYRSTGKLLVRSGVREAGTPETDVASGISASLSSTREAVSTELHLLQNPKIVERVVERIGAARILEFRDPGADDGDSTPLPSKLLHQFQSRWYAPPAEDLVADGASVAVAVDVLFGGLYPSGGPTSSVIDVSYRGQNPEICHDVVDAFLEAAVEHHREVFAATRELDLTREREQEARKDSVRANEALAGFRIEHGVFEIDAKMSALLAQISTLEAKMAADAEENKRLRQQLTFLNARIGDEEEAATEQAAPVINPAHTNLEQRLYDLNLRRMDMELRTGETLEELRKRQLSVDDLIAKTETELAQQSAFLPAANASRDRLIAQRDKVLESLAALLGMAEQQAGRVGALRAELVKIQKAEPEYMRLYLNAEQSLHRVDAAVDAFEKLNLMTLLDERNLSNLRILQEATYDEDKIGPSRSKFLMLGGMLGLAMGMTLAMAFAVLDPRLRRPSELAVSAACPILGVLPELRRKLATKGLCDFDPGDSPSPYQELIDTLWSGLVPDGIPAEQMRIAFVGEDAQVGCSTVAACAGIGLAERLRAKVLIIETAQTGAGLAALLSVEQGPGLCEVLDGRTSLEDAIRPTRIPGLSILAAGGDPRSDPGRFAGMATQRVLEEAGKGFQFVLVDMSSPIRQPEARLLLWEVPAAVVVARGGVTRKDRIRNLAEVIGACGGRLLGAVFNRYRTVRPVWMPGPDEELAVSTGIAVTSPPTRRLPA